MKHVSLYVHHELNDGSLSCLTRNMKRLVGSSAKKLFPNPPGASIPVSSCTSRLLWAVRQELCREKLNRSYETFMLECVRWTEMVVRKHPEVVATLEPA